MVKTIRANYRPIKERFFIAPLKFIYSSGQNKVPTAELKSRLIVVQ